METEQELNDKILAIITRIREQHPELAVYMAEMRVTIPDEKYPEKHVQNLHNYYETLKSILRKFANEQAEQH